MKAICVNTGATALEAVAVTGTGSVVKATSPTITSPTLVTPTLGVATATSINSLTITTSTGTLTITNGKTFSVSNTLTITGTDGSTLAIGTGGTLGTGAYATIANYLTTADAATTYAPKASPTFTGTVTIPTPFTLGATSVTATGTELNYVDGVTSAIQTQLDAKAPLADAALTGSTTAETITASNLKATATIGFHASAGAAVVQDTSKSTGVTIDAPTGSITTHGAQLVAGAEVSFTVTNNKVAAIDLIILNIRSGATADTYAYGVQAVAAGSFSIMLSNISTTNRSDTIVLSFAIIKGQDGV